MSDAARPRRQRQGARALRARRRPPAARRERPDLDLRRRAARPRSPTRDASSPASRRSGSRRRPTSCRTTCSRCATTVARPSAGGSRCCRSSASSAAISPAPAGRTTSRLATVCGHALPPGLVESQRLPEPIFTPATKAQTGPRREHRPRRGGRSSSARSGSTRRAALARALPVRVRARGGARDPPRGHEARVRRRRARAARPRRRGVHARLVALLAGRRVRARRRRSRRSTSSSCATTASRLGWDKTYPGPELPDDVVAGTRARYVEAFERLTEIPFARLRRAPRGRARMRATVLVRPKPGILDPQGQAVESSLRHLGFAVDEARVGRVVDLELDTDDATEARAQIERHVRAAARQPADRELRDRARTAARTRAASSRSAAADRGRRVPGVERRPATPQLALERLGAEPARVWHAESELPDDTAAVVLPGGFSYGDYLRCGAIARFSPVMAAVARFAGEAGSCSGSATASRS